MGILFLGGRGGEGPEDAILDEARNYFERTGHVLRVRRVEATSLLSLVD